MKSQFLTMLPMFLCCAVPTRAQNPATAVGVDASVNRHPINPNIYGVAYGDATDMAKLNLPLNRWGGNSTTRYNWRIDAHSAAADWYFETYSDGDGTPSGSADAFVATTRAAANGAEPMFTIPMIDWLANLGPGRSTLEGFSVKIYGAQTAADPWNPDAGNGVSASTGHNITGNDPLDTGVLNSTATQQAWVQHFVTKYGLSSTATGIKYYILDNEPSIWFSTHRDVHPNPPTYEEIFTDVKNYATAIRAVDPAAKIAGPEEWGWWAMYVSGFDQANGAGAANSDYNTHNQTYYYPWLLQQIAAYKQQTGTQLIDVLTVHGYNQTPDGSDDSLAGQLARNRETRILWDPNFQDPSWYGDIDINSNGRVLNWIPSLKAMVNQYCPGLQIGCTEYNWGDEPNLNGATTQADVLGIYGREGVDLATRWTVAKNGTTYYVTYLASQIYRNYDGNNSTFGDTSVSASVANPDNLSAFAAIRGSDGAMTVMVINKQQGSTPVTVSVANFPTTGTAQVWQISSASQTSIAHLADVAVASNSITTTVPSQSITLFVIPTGSVTSPPSAPAGLAATVGDGTVTLTWNAGGGATSYTVQRATVSGGPYATRGTVTSPSPTTYTDSGLTDGTTYYYVVSGSNSAGTSPNSAELAATPIVPPTFTSSATAAPNPVVQGNSTAVTATVADTAHTLSNGIVQVVVVDPSGNTVASQNFTGQSFAASQSQTYNLTFVPASAGTFVVEIGVFSTTWQLWSWNASAAAVTVNSALSFSATATATPTSVKQGSSTAIAFTVTDTGAADLANGNVEMQVFDGSGNVAATNVWGSENLTAGQSYPFNYTWDVPASQATGTYTGMIGVFDGGWATDYYWNNNGATITITPGSVGPAAPTGLTATSGNAQVVLSWTASSSATSYSIFRGTTAGAEGAAAIATGIIAPSYTDTGLTNGTTYFYKVAAVNASGTGSLSDEAGATPQTPVEPASQVIAAGGTAIFSVTPAGMPAPTCQWQVSSDGGRTWTSLTDTSPYSGTTTSTLTITGATAAMNGNSFTCVMTGSTGTNTALPGTLVVEAPLTVFTFAGLAGVNGSLDGSAAAARFANPADVAVDAAGILYVADAANHTVRKVTPAGAVTTLAGVAGVSGSTDGTGVAQFNHPTGVAVDTAGNVYVADTNNNEVRKVTASGAVTTLAGLAGATGSADGSGSAARFNGPSGIAADGAGNLYVADTLNHTIRRITPGGVVTTLAGTAGTSGLADATRSAALFHGPKGLALDAEGDLFVADTNNNAIRKIVTATGVVTTVAGQAGAAGSTDGANSQAQFHFPSGVAVDAAGNIYVADTENDTLREIAPSGAVSTLAGQAGVSGSTDGSGTAAGFAFPTGVAVDSSGNVYVADTNNDTIRLAIIPASPAITQQPQSQTATAGANVTFTVTATGNPAPTYQWNFNGQAISSATSNTLSLSGVVAADAGNYTVTVTNSSGTVTSNAATLTVNPAGSGGGGGGSSGGGGGGAPSTWFCGALLLLAAGRKFQRRAKPVVP